MMVRIITDSAADFEPFELERLNIECIPLTVIFGDDEYQENVNLSKKRFYELLLESKQFPTTSQASPEILKGMFRSAAECGDEAIYITISSGFSNTFQNALLTRREFDGAACHVVDSQNGTGGQRMMVEQAVKLRDAGLSAGEIVRALEQLRSRIELYACMDTLEYLYKGGRISHAIYKLGTIARIKPILQVAHDGHLAVPAKTMGMRKGMDFLCKRLELVKPDPDYPLYVMYTSDRTIAETLAGCVRQMGYEVPDERIIAVGAAIGAHVGPGACGLVYVGEQR